MNEIETELNSLKTDYSEWWQIPHDDLEKFTASLKNQSQLEVFHENLHMLGSHGSWFTYDIFAKALVRRAYESNPETTMQEV